MELRSLYDNSGSDEISEPYERCVTEVKPIAIKPAWKSSRIFEPHAVTYVTPRPRDRFNFVKLVVLLQGMALFWPFNAIINAETFFRDYKLNNSLNNGSDLMANKLGVNLMDENQLIFYFCITSTVSSLIAIVFNLLLPISPVWSLTRRITLSATLQALVISLIVITSTADTTSYHSVYLLVSLILLILLNVSNGVFQSCVHAITAFLPTNYRKTLMFGIYFGGVLSTGLQLTSLAVFDSQRLAYVYYFIASIIILLLFYDFYYISPFSRFYRYYRSKARNNSCKEYYDICLTDSSDDWSLSLVLSNCWKHYLNIYLVCLVSYTIYPSLSVNAKPVPDFLSFIPKQYYNPIATHLVFNTSSAVGCLTASLIASHKDKDNSAKLLLTSALRLSLIPIYVFTFFRTELHPILALISNDLTHLVSILVLGLSNGSLLTASVMKAAKCVKTEQSLTAGMLTALFMTSGLMSGAIFSLVIHMFLI